MKRLVPSLLILSILPAGGDIVRLLNGGEREGTVKSYDGQGLTLSVRVQSGMAETRIPAGIIERVDIIPTGQEQEALADPRADNVLTLSGLWARHGILGGRRGSKAYPVAEALAEAIARQGAKDAPEQLVKLAKECSRLPGDKTLLEAKIKAIQIRILMQAGRTEEAERIATALKNSPAGRSEAPELAEARVLLDLLAAQKSWQALRQLEEDWPKWRQMPEKEEERRRLLNETLNRNLVVVVDNPRLTDLCAQALLGAAEAYAHSGQREEALQRAREILDWYPAEPHRTKAEELVASLASSANTSPNP